jgi:peptidoglycan-N-acetylglucosamine deacetylase
MTGLVRTSVAAALILLTSAIARAEGQAVAVTFDDLPGPAAGLVSNEIGPLRETTRKLLAAFAEYRIPVVGFVNEGKLTVEGEGPSGVEARTAVLQTWVDAGHELGNHSYSHFDLNHRPLEEFQADVIRGEPVTRRLLQQRGSSLRYFRHPFLHVGLELPKRRAFEAFLAARGYQVAPVTIDNDEFIYAAVYADALRRSGTATAARVADDYVRYMESVVGFAEAVTRNLLGRDMRHVLLVHANSLNADHFARLAGLLKTRGYRFIPLAEALEDPAYRSADDYVGGWGISWLHHWEITAGRMRSPSPDPPAWIMKAYEALGR